MYYMTFPSRYMTFYLTVYDSASYGTEIIPAMSFEAMVFYPCL